MTKKKTNPTKAHRKEDKVEGQSLAPVINTEKEVRPFLQGRTLYEDTRLGYKVYIEAALWSAETRGVPLAEVKDYIKRMVSDHIIQELGYDPS